MKSYRESVINQNGVPVGTPTITVYLQGTSTLATLYTNSTGTSLANPFTGDSRGNFEFFAEDGRYDVVISGGSPSITSYTISDAEVSDVFEKPTEMAHMKQGANAGAKIAQAITDLPSAGGTVDARGLEGTQAASAEITISKPVTIIFGEIDLTFTGGGITIASSGVRLTGQGVESVLTRADVQQRLIEINDGTNDVEIDHLKLVGSGTLSPLGRGVISVNVAGTSTGTARINIHDNFISHPSTCAISGNFGSDVFIRNNFTDSEGSGEKAVYISQAGSVVPTRIIVSENICEGTGSTLEGMYFRGTHIQVSRNVITGWQAGIGFGSTTTVTDSSITDNIIQTPTLYGIWGEDTASRMTIARNKIMNASTNGFRFDAGLTNSIFSDNDVYLAGASGWRMNGLSNCVFSGNRVRDVDSNADGASGDESSGFRLNSLVTDCLFVGNHVSSSNVASFHKYSLSWGADCSGNQFMANHFGAARTSVFDAGNSTCQFLDLSDDGELAFGSSPVPLSTFGTAIGAIGTNKNIALVPTGTGGVAIGSGSTPSDMLQVNGNISFGGDGGTRFQLTGTPTAGRTWTFPDVQATVYGHVTTGLGDGAGTNLQAPAKGTGTGPTSLTVATWSQINIGGTTYWVPLFQ